MQDRSIPNTAFCLSKDGWLRRNLIPLATSPLTDVVLASLVIAHAIAMGFFNPLLPSDSPRNSAITYVTLVVNAVFAVELVIKLVAMGAWGRGSYFVGRSGAVNMANCLDFAIVALGFAAVSPRVGQVSALRLLRLLRWAYARVPSMRVILLACINALPGLGGVLTFAGMTYLVFGLIGERTWRQG